MNYPELLQEDHKRTRSLFLRCSKMLTTIINANDIMIHDMKFLFREDQIKNLNDAEIAWQLYRLDRGICYYSNNNFSDGNWKGTWNTFKFSFGSLDELELKLTIKGY